MITRHNKLTTRWSSFSKKEQLFKIATRLDLSCQQKLARDLKKENPNISETYEKTLELLDLTLIDPKWCDSTKEIHRFRDVVASLYINRTDAVIDRFLYGWLIKTSEIVA